MRIPNYLHADTVTIVQAAPTGGLDADGVPQTAPPVETQWPGVNVQQVNTNEDTTGYRDQTARTYRVAGSPPAVTITAADTIRWGGTDYAVIGEPDIRTGRNRINHTSLEIQRITG